MVVPRCPFLLSWLLPLLLLVMANLCHASPGEAILDFSECLFEGPKTLGAEVVAIDRESGHVECKGVDSAATAAVHLGLGRRNEEYEGSFRRITCTDVRTGTTSSG